MDNTPKYGEIEEKQEQSRVLVYFFLFFHGSLEFAWASDLEMIERKIFPK